ncbi:MAG: hypothetical protein IK121_09310, partial [Lachnospiraceae bacterium]|nr:hypothetical protein [Lachnospiraceae bacterium]
MGKKDIEEKRFMQIPENFADLCNGVLFGGKQVVKPEELEYNPTEVLKDKSSVMSDVAKRWKRNNTVISVIEVENQSQTDYAMVIRNVNMIASRYMNQLSLKQDASRRRRGKRPGSIKATFISGFAKDDLLIPVIVIVINYDENEWDGKRKLIDMLDLRGFPKECERYLLNYEMVLYDYNEYENFDVFKGELRTVFEVLKLQKKKEELLQYVTNRENPLPIT